MKLDLNDGRVRLGLILLGIVLVLGLFVGLFWPKSKPVEPLKVEEAALPVTVSEVPADAKKQAPCFVDGQIVGQMTISECAKRNHVDPKSLDVGTRHDDSLPSTEFQTPNAPNGAPDTGVANPQGRTASATLRGVDQAQAVNPAPTPTSAACLRFGGGEWRQAADHVSKSQCAKILFPCEKGARDTYGRWGETSLRLVSGKIEQSLDGKVFSPFMDVAKSCPNS